MPPNSKNLAQSGVDRHIGHGYDGEAKTVLIRKFNNYIMNGGSSTKERTGAALEAAFNEGVETAVRDGCEYYKTRPEAVQEPRNYVRAALL
jgi:hypothetical protein